jgi:hypothetical protein
VSQCSSLERLYVDGLRFENMDALTRLPGLAVLSVDSATKVLSFADLGRLASLRGLSIVNSPKVHSLLPLRELRHLEALVVAGIWTRMTVDTLDPSPGYRFAIPELTNLSATSRLSRCRISNRLKSWTCQLLPGCRIADWQPG